MQRHLGRALAAMLVPAVPAQAAAGGYRGAGVDLFGLPFILQASEDGSASPSVPEPASWGLMIGTKRREAARTALA